MAKPTSIKPKTVRKRFNELLQRVSEQEREAFKENFEDVFVLLSQGAKELEKVKRHFRTRKAPYKSFWTHMGNLNHCILTPVFAIEGRVL